MRKIIHILMVLWTCLFAAQSSADPQNAEVQVHRNIAYGPHERQRLDVYFPRQSKAAPVLFMVHGGGWRRGDKSMPAVIENKLARWVPKGFVFISTNYRLLPEAKPVEQAKDVALAVAFAQRKAEEWGADAGKFILMGHSAGAHLVTLLASSPQLTKDAGVTTWLGTIALDSAAFDVESLMRGDHYRLHDRAFGKDPEYWRAASPFYLLKSKGAPFFAVCAVQREHACDQAQRYSMKATALGADATVLPLKLTHREINTRLGLPGTYTDAVEAFLRRLDPSVAARL